MGTTFANIFFYDVFVTTEHQAKWEVLKLEILRVKNNKINIISNSWT